MASPLFSRVNVACLFFLLSSVYAQFAPGGLFLAGNGAPGAGSYALVDDYEGSSGNFFGKFVYDDVGSHSLLRGLLR